VLVAHHLPKLVAHLATALAILLARNLIRKEAAWRRGASGRKERGGT
jgi:hypothetical protein